MCGLLSFVRPLMWALTIWWLSYNPLNHFGKMCCVNLPWFGLCGRYILLQWGFGALVWFHNFRLCLFRIMRIMFFSLEENSDLVPLSLFWLKHGKSYSIVHFGEMFAQMIQDRILLVDLQDRPGLMSATFPFRRDCFLSSSRIFLSAPLSQNTLIWQ